jgi:hypothetical protein
MRLYTALAMHLLGMRLNMTYLDDVLIDVFVSNF